MGSGPSVSPCSSSTSQNKFTHDNISRQLYKNHTRTRFLVFFFHPHSLSDVTSLNRPQISQRNFENSKLPVMSKAKTMQTREIHPTQADRSTKNNCILLNAQTKRLQQFQLDFSCTHLYQQMTVAKNVQIILKTKI